MIGLDAMIATRTKIAFAAAASALVSGGRSVLGRDSSATVWRGGLRWQLDLREGIDFSIYLLGGFERRTAAAMRTLVQPGSVVFDIGANVGAHTLGIARSVGPAGCVVAVEPSDEAFAKLTRNVSINPELQGRVRLRQLLLAASAEAVAPPALYASWPLHPTGPVHPKHGGRLVTMTGASVDTLDHVMAREGLERLDLIKLDVDGFEARVLEGGLGTLRRHQPVIVMEFAPYVHAEAGGSFADLVRLLKESSYRVVEASNGRAVPLDVEGLKRRIPDGASVNVIARASRSGEDAARASG
jgi:FkbM family methyltransferase